VAALTARHRIVNRPRTVFLAISLVVVLPIAATTLLGQSEQSDAAGGDSLYRYLSVFTEVLGLVRHAYVDPVDTDALMAGALDGAPDALDPFSTFIPAAAVDDFESVKALGPRHSGLVLARESGALFALSVLEGSPAAEAGLQTGDLFAQLNGRSTRQMPLWRAEEILAGEPGTGVDVEYFRRGERATATIELAAFELPAPRLDERQGMSILRIPSLEAADAERIAGLLRTLPTDTGSGLLVDLRGVAGGDPEVGYSIARLFAAGELGHLRGSNGAGPAFAGAEPIWQGPLVVLVDRFTEGGAEILSQVLRQKAGADLVGQTTFGHAGRLAEIPLSNGSRLMLTTDLYTGPDGKSLGEGLEPDEVVDGSTRTFAEKDLSLEALTLRRGMERLREKIQGAKRKAA
jgi:carboxyl-terminal processing protease